ncbi:MAG: hypothetical protein QNJ72_19750 [Pleurocapsa sp. MO_226.B13]|nr:hypothetical protein [Pleurocapsa sp. MO_226.B13]
MYAIPNSVCCIPSANMVASTAVVNVGLKFLMVFVPFGRLLIALVLVVNLV